MTKYDCQFRVKILKLFLAQIIVVKNTTLSFKMFFLHQQEENLEKLFFIFINIQKKNKMAGIFTNPPWLKKIVGYE